MVLVCIAPIGYLLVVLFEQVVGVALSQDELNGGNIAIDLCRNLEVVTNRSGFVQRCLVSSELLLEGGHVLSIFLGQVDVVAELLEFGCTNIGNSLARENHRFLQLRVHPIDELCKVFWLVGGAEELEVLFRLLEERGGI